MIKLFVFIYGKRMGELKWLSAIQISKPLFSRNINKPKYFLSKNILENFVSYQVHVLCMRPYTKNITWKGIVWVFDVRWNTCYGHRMTLTCHIAYFFTVFFLIIAFIRWCCSNNSPVLSHVLSKKSVFIFCKSADKLFP